MLYPDALAPADADRLFAVLHAGIDWRQEIATLMGRRVPIPRLTAWHGAAGYVYSGIRLTPGTLDAAAARAQGAGRGLAGQPFNSVLLNLYRDGRDSVSWHADNEPGLGRDPVIASISLGAVRRFQLKHRRAAPTPDASISPTAPAWSWPARPSTTGSTSCPRPRRAVGPRINLTFRQMLQ